MNIKSLITLFAAGLFTAAVALAADPAPVTLVGAGQCAKCSLGLTDTCQNVVVVTKDGKDQIYFLTQNDLSQKFHDNICTETKQIKVVGTVKEVAGKMEITPTSIELVKK